MKFGLPAVNHMAQSALPTLPQFSTGPSASYSYKDLIAQAAQLEQSTDAEPSVEAEPAANRDAGDHTRPQILAIVSLLTRLNGKVIKEHIFTSDTNSTDFVCKLELSTPVVYPASLLRTTLVVLPP